MADKGDWRALIGLGLVILLIGLIGTNTAALTIGLICVVAGGAWRILRGPDRPTQE